MHLLTIADARSAAIVHHSQGSAKLLPISALVAVCVLASGCFVYQQTDPTAVKPNQPIRVVVTNDEGLRLAREFGYGAPVLEGEFSSLSRDSLQLAVWVGKEFRATDFSMARQTIPVVRQDILNVQLKRFSPKRTVLFAAGVAAVATIVLNRVGIIDLPWDEGSENTTPPEPEPFHTYRIRKR
jgi:hypothetical protein